MQTKPQTTKGQGEEPESAQHLETLRELRQFDKQAFAEREKELLRIGTRYLDEIVKVQSERDHYKASAEKLAARLEEVVKWFETVVAKQDCLKHGLAQAEERWDEATNTSVLDMSKAKAELSKWKESQ